MLKTYTLFIIKAFLLLPATFLHELMHLLGALITGSKIKSFNILPKIEKDQQGYYHFIYGKVQFYPRILGLSFIAGLAPMVLWVILFLFLIKMGIIIIYSNGFGIVTEDLFTKEYIWIWIISLELFFGGFPSITDIAVSLRGLLSISGFILILGSYSYFLISRPETIENFILALVDLVNIVKP